jgi:hypothetical protein
MAVPAAVALILALGGGLIGAGAVLWWTRT